MNEEKTQLFEHILLRPAMYFGNDKNYVEHLSTMDFGFSTGFQMAKNDRSQVYSIVPNGFPEFVVEKLGKNEKRPNWIYRLLDSAQTKEESFELLKSLYQEFKNKDDNQSVVTTPDAARPTS